jgi:hypothetical protein
MWKLPMRYPTNEGPKICWATCVEVISSIIILSKGFDIVFHEMRGLFGENDVFLRYF